MVRWRKKKTHREKLHVNWPEVSLSEDDMQHYFQFLLTPHVFGTTIPFLFGPQLKREQNPQPGH